MGIGVMRPPIMADPVVDDEQEEDGSKCSMLHLEVFLIPMNFLASFLPADFAIVDNLLGGIGGNLSFG